MNNGVQEAHRTFIKNLTRASTREIQEYIAEITSNREFHDCLEENRGGLGGRRLLSWGSGVGATLGTALYALCRKLRPDTVVETGVDSGVSSAYILCALEENRHGALYSIDIPWQETVISWRRYFTADGVSSLLTPKDRPNGWIIPDHLRHRWQLIIGRTAEELSPLLEKLGAIDIFLHDSDHSYENMLWEYQAAWTHLKVGGILLSHNIDANNAFTDFCQSVEVRGHLLTDMGGIAKA